MSAHLRSLASALAGVTIALGFLTVPAAAQEDAALTHARALLKTVPLIDGHNDLPWEIRMSETAPMDVQAYNLNMKTPGNTDIARLRAGEVGAQFWSIYIPGEAKDSGYARMQLEEFDIARRMIAMYPKDLQFVTTADGIEQAFKAGKIGSLLGLEGGHAIENSLGALRSYYELGARYMTLTHNVTLDWADAAQDSAKHNGLTPFGREVVREMNRLGMMVDLSHVSPAVMSNVLDIAESPVIFSHSSARAITDHKRNVPDSILKRLPKNGGVVMVTFVPSFVNPQYGAWEASMDSVVAAGLAATQDSAVVREQVRAWRKEHPLPPATLSDVADHIEHIRKVAGVDHIGLGSDFDGMGPVTPVGLSDVSMFPDLFAELIRRGWKDGDLKKLAGENMLRVLRANEATARRLQATRQPSTKTIQQMDGPGAS
ncbi:MAG TPA: dipeptidase [Gemmatimonadales bacterium]|nr:dipeptidase [Gemmatimonadales bacterium]